MDEAGQYGNKKIEYKMKENIVHIMRWIKANSKKNIIDFNGKPMIAWTIKVL